MWLRPLLALGSVGARRGIASPVGDDGVIGPRRGRAGASGSGSSGRRARCGRKAVGRVMYRAQRAGLLRARAESSPRTRRASAAARRGPPRSRRPRERDSGDRAPPGTRGAGVVAAAFAGAPNVASSSRATISTKPTTPFSARMRETASSAMSYPAPRNPAPMMRTQSCARRRPCSKRVASAIMSSSPNSGLELGQRAERQAQLVGGAVEPRLDLAAMLVGHVVLKCVSDLRV